MRKFQLLLLTAPVIIIMILFLITMPVFASTSSCEQDYIHSQMQEDYYGDYPTMNSNIGIFIKVVRWGDPRDGATPFEVPKDIKDGELLQYDTFEEYIYEGTRGSFDLLRTAIIKCSWSAKRLNDIQDGLEERHAYGEVDFLDDIDALYYTLEYVKVKIESYPYVCKN
jgi:hypothetical protein